MAKIKNIRGSNESINGVVFINNVLTDLSLIDLKSDLELFGLILHRIEANDYELYDDLDNIINTVETQYFDRVDNNGNSISQGEVTIRQDIIELNKLVNNG